MSRYLIILCFLFTITLSYSLVPEESALISDREDTTTKRTTIKQNQTTVLDDQSDLAGGWDTTVIKQWFKYANYSYMLQDYAGEGQDWSRFKSFGIWGLFDPNPPVAHPPSPSFAYLGGIPYSHIIIKCYMEGNSSIDVYSDGVQVGEIKNEGMTEFQEYFIPLVDNEDSLNFNFNVTLRVSSNKDSILIDWIKASQGYVPPSITTKLPLDCPDDMILETSGDINEEFGWNVKQFPAMLEYFDDNTTITTWWAKFAAEYEFPAKLNWTRFENTTGAWLIYNYIELGVDFEMGEKIPTFQFEAKEPDDFYSSVFIRCYLHQSTSIIVYHGLNETVEVGSPDVDDWQEMSINLPPGISNFSVQVNLDGEGDFVFIDMMTAVPWPVKGCQTTKETTSRPTETTTVTAEMETTERASTQTTISEVISTTAKNNAANLTQDQAWISLLILQLSILFVYLK